MASVTSHARECASVTYGTSGLVELEFAGTVSVHEMGNVVGRFQVGVLRVPILTTERRFDLRMTYQAVRHLRHSCGGNLIGLLQSAVASLAGVSVVEVAANFARRLQIVLVIDRDCNEGRNVTYPQMQRVAELR